LSGGAKVVTKMKQRQPNRYSAIIEQIFRKHYSPDTSEFTFHRSEIEKVAKELSIVLPKNLGDVLYSFRYRTLLPKAVLSAAGKGKTWLILPAGRALYRFSLIEDRSISPNRSLSETKVPDATPGIISKYSLSDEQALLAKVRYNRLIDIFTGVACYSLQSHLRTTVPDMGQVETDEIYVGIDKRGVQYVFPVQAKGGRDHLDFVQISQDFGVGESKFPSLVCRPIGTQFTRDDAIVLFEFERTGSIISVVSEKHYRLVHPDEITPSELIMYRNRTGD
jgi:hypothetical protein